MKAGGWGRAVVLGGRKITAEIGGKLSAMAYESKLLNGERNAEV